jgi:hypothetical protein
MFFKYFIYIYIFKRMQERDGYGVYVALMYKVRRRCDVLEGGV